MHQLHRAPHHLDQDAQSHEISAFVMKMWSTIKVQRMITSQSRQIRHRRRFQCRGHHFKRSLQSMNLYAYFPILPIIKMIVSLWCPLSRALAQHKRSPTLRPQYLSVDNSPSLSPIPTAALFRSKPEQIDYRSVAIQNRPRIDTLSSLPTIPSDDDKYEYKMHRKSSLSDISNLSLSFPKDIVFQNKHHDVHPTVHPLHHTVHSPISPLRSPPEPDSFSWTATESLPSLPGSHSRKSDKRRRSMYVMWYLSRFMFLQFYLMWFIVSDCDVCQESTVLELVVTIPFKYWP